MASFLKSIAKAYSSPSSFRVRFSHAGDGWKADKSYEEALAAYQAGSHVEAEVPNAEVSGEVLIIPLRFCNTSKWLAALTFYWERTFVPPGGYGDVKVYSVEATLQPGGCWADVYEKEFPACTCGREQPHV